MQIELLWIIPIVSFAFFVFLLIYFAQKNNPEQPYRDLAKEVNRFNNGIVDKKVVIEKPDSRLNELEKSIFTLTDSITNQQRVIDGFQQSNVANQTEMKDLRQKLRDIYKEYDIVVSENYSLKATVKKLKDQKSEGTAHADNSPLTYENDPEPNSNRSNLRLYEDTRLLNANSLEDTSEIDLAQVM
jgi:GTPase involved in cell partitioning and DNA repair